MSVFVWFMEVRGPSGTLQVFATVVVGLALVGYGGYSLMMQSSALENSVEVNATVQSTGVDTVSQRRGTEYRPTASFNYSYDGENYSSSNVYPGNNLPVGSLEPTYNSREKASSALKDYEMGSQVTAYINSNSPSNGYLKHESSNKPYFIIFIGLLFVSFGVYSTVWK